MDEFDKAEVEAPELYKNEPVTVAFHSGKLWVTLADGRTIGTPLAWYPRLMMASPQEREQVQLGPDGLHWPKLDEDLSVNGMLNGRKPPRTLRERLEKYHKEQVCWETTKHLPSVGTILASIGVLSAIRTIIIFMQIRRYLVAG